MTDERQPKPNLAVAEPITQTAPPEPTAQPGSTQQAPDPAKPEEAQQAKAPGEPERTGKPKEPKRKRTLKRTLKAEPPLKLPRLGETQRLVLVALPTISVTELAERLDLTRPAVSRALHSLTSAGLATPTDGQNRGWKSAWKLTRLGERAAAELSFDSVRRVHELIGNRPHNLPAAAEEALADAEERLGALL